MTRPVAIFLVCKFRGATRRELQLWDRALARRFQLLKGHPLAYCRRVKTFSSDDELVQRIEAWLGRLAQHLKIVNWDAVCVVSHQDNPPARFHIPQSLTDND